MEGPWSVDLWQAYAGAVFTATNKHIAANNSHPRGIKELYLCRDCLRYSRGDTIFLDFHLVGTSETYIYIYMYMYTYMYIYIYMYTYVYMYTCIQVHVHVHIDIDEIYIYVMCAHLVAHMYLWSIYMYT